MTMQQNGDWRKLLKALGGLSEVNFRSLHKRIGEYQLKATRDRFEKGVDPEGKPWQRSLRVQTAGGQTMMDTRLLQQSLTYKAESDRVQIGTPDWRAPLLNDGKTSSGSTTIRAKKGKGYLVFRAGGRWFKVKEVRLVARPFNGINRTNQDEIRKIVTKAIEEAGGT